MGFIYKIPNDITNKVYVGQTSKTFEELWKKHLYDSTYCEKNNHFYNAIKLYGYDCWSHEVLEECPNEILNDIKRWWIKHFISFLDGWSEEDKEKFSNSKLGENHPMFGKCWSEEYKRNMSEACKGISKSEKTKEKMRKPKSEEAKVNMKLGWVKRKANLNDPIYF